MWPFHTGGRLKTCRGSRSTKSCLEWEYVGVQLLSTYVNGARPSRDRWRGLATVPRSRPRDLREESRDGTPDDGDRSRVGERGLMVAHIAVRPPQLA
ncbi:hypothetical protein MRX96_005784 [Rhipicephalus microplus]